MSSTIADLTDGVTANATDRLPGARDPFGAGDNIHVTPAYIRTHILALAAAWPANGAASTPPMLLSGTWFTGGSATTTKPQSLVEPAGTTSTGWSTAGTGFGVNAPSGFTGNLVDFQVDGVSKFSIAGSGSGGGTVTMAGGQIGASGLWLVSTSGGAIEYARFGSSQLSVTSNTPIGWTSSVNSADSGLRDLALHRDGAALLALRNDTVAQSFRVYGTFTNSSNYERGALNAGADYIELAAETAGTGDDNMDVRLTPAGTGNVRFGTVTGSGDVAVNGFVTIKDAAGNAVKLATVA